MILIELLSYMETQLESIQLVASLTPAAHRQSMLDCGLLMAVSLG